MNSRLEAQRARQNRVIALIFTFLFHVALFGGIYYFSTEQSEAKEEKIKQAGQSEETRSAQPQSNATRPLKP